jgi:TRAP-type C4-dicarboxylate transport system permease small subunit
MFERISKGVACLNRYATAVASLGLLFMTGLVTADVIRRRLFNAPLIYADEVAGYLLVLVTMLGLGYTLKEEGHIQVMLVIQRLSARQRTILRLIWCVIGIVYATILLIYTGQLAWESFTLKAFSPTPSQLPIYPFQVLMPIGCVLLLFQLVMELLHSAFSLMSFPKEDVE